MAPGSGVFHGVSIKPGHRDWLHQLNERDWCRLQKVMDSLKRMENFCRTKKNMFLFIRDGIIEALREMQLLKEGMKRNDC